MPKLLTADQVSAYRRDGFHFPVRVLSAAEARAYRDRLEAQERALGGPLTGNMRHKLHLLFTWANELARHPAILDAVEDVIGPDILCWSTTFFTKEAHSPSFVSWHQDATYWGLSTDDVITAWVAFADAPVESGAMKFWPGSHLKKQLEHRDTFAKDNLLTRGQEIAVDVPAGEGVDVPLKAGEMSLHHVLLVHGSGPNTTDDRRIGYAIRYIPPHVRQLKVRDSAMLVRGQDRHGNFDPEPAPRRRPRRRRPCRPSRRRRALGQGALCRHRPHAVPCLAAASIRRGALCALPVGPRSAQTQSPQAFLQSIYDALSEGRISRANPSGRSTASSCRTWRAPSTPTCGTPSGAARCPSSTAIPSSTPRTGTSRTSPYRSRPTDRRRPARSASTISASPPRSPSIWSRPRLGWRIADIKGPSGSLSDLYKQP